MNLDLLGLDQLHSDEEREISSTVRRLLDDQLRPHIAQWYEDGRVPVRANADGIAFTFRIGGGVGLAARPGWCGILARPLR